MRPAPPAPFLPFPPFFGNLLMLLHQHHLRAFFGSRSVLVEFFKPIF